MTMNTLPATLGIANGALDKLAGILTEIRGLSIGVGAGAGIGTKVGVTGMTDEDTILSVIRSVAGVLTDVTSHYSIVATHASGTLTAASVAAADTCVVNGTTFTARVAPTLPTEFKIGGTDTITATNLVNAINAYENRRLTTGKQNVAQVVATSALGVVTITSVADGTAGNALTLTGTATRLAASGSGTLAGGLAAASGGVKSDADHSATSSIVVFWYNKK